MDFDAQLTSVKALYDAGKYQEALGPARALYEESAKAHGKEDPRTARALYRLAEVVYEIDGPAAGLALHLEALATRERVLPADDLEIAESLNCVGNCHMYADRYAEAAAMHGRALALRKKADPGAHVVAEVLNNIAHSRMRQGAYADAQGVLEDAVAITEKLGSPRPEELGIMLNNLASVHQHLGNFDEAERAYRRSIDAKRRVLQPGHPSLARSYGNLASLLELMGKPDEADRLFAESLAINEASFGPGDSRVTGEQALLALRLESRGKLKEAEDLLRKTVAAAEVHRGADHLEVGARLMSLARFLAHQARGAEADQCLDRAVAIAAKAGGGGLELRAEVLECRATIAHERGDLPAAEALFQQVLEIRETQPFVTPIQLAFPLLQYADLCFQMGRDAKAQLLYERAWQPLDEDATSGDEMVVHICLQLACLAYRLGQAERAPRWAARALARLSTAQAPPPREVLDETLDLLERTPSKSRGLLARVGALVGGARERPELWVAALESLLQEGRERDARRLAPRAAELAAGDPALAARVQAAKARLEGA